MQAEIQGLLEKQAAWQRSRAARPWSEKLRAAVALRSAFLALRRPTPPRRPTTSPPTKDAVSR